MSSTHLIHTIAPNSTFDADIELVESFVRARQNPHDDLVQDAVFLYYKSRLKSYLAGVKDYLHSGKYKDQFEDIVKDRTFKENGLSEDEFMARLPDFEDIILNNINSLTTLDLKKIIEIFMDIGQLSCLQAPSTQYYYADVPFEYCYPLPNNTGFFGFNSFLYAYYEKVFLIGIPLTLSYYDKNKSCPRGFIEHDLAHATEMFEDIEGRTLPDHGRAIYYNILNDFELTQLQKECLILAMWIDIHETRFAGYTDRYINSPKRLAFQIKASFSLFEQNIGEDFLSLFRQFDSILLNRDLVESLFREDDGVLELLDEPELQDEPDYLNDLMNLYHGACKWNLYLYVVGMFR